MATVVVTVEVDPSAEAEVTVVVVVAAVDMAAFGEGKMADRKGGFAEQLVLDRDTPSTRTLPACSAPVNWGSAL